MIRCDNCGRGDPGGVTSPDGSLCLECYTNPENQAQRDRIDGFGPGERQSLYEQMARKYGDIEGGTYFAGTVYPDEPDPEMNIVVFAGNDRHKTVIRGRDLEKFMVQAKHYSNGNVAQFILDVFNRFVDRYEEYR